MDRREYVKWGRVLKGVGVGAFVFFRMGFAYAEISSVVIATPKFINSSLSPNIVLDKLNAGFSSSSISLNPNQYDLILL